MRSVLKTASLALAMAAVPATAFAHVGIGDTHGFVHGFAHPIGGADHVLAMVAVGLFAAHLGGRALWLVPATFVAMMAAGGLLGIEGIEIPYVETMVAGSVIMLGLAIGLQWSPPVLAATGVVGFFAAFHGHAHGAEMPADASGLGYALGFMLATALLHALGIAVGLALGRTGRDRSRLVLRVGGGAMMLAGVALLAA